MEQKKLRVIFTDQVEETFDQLAQTHDLQETDEEFNSYLENGNESREMILRDAIEVMAKKMIPEKKLIELLEKHLTISKESAEQIVKEVKEKILPILFIYPDEKFNDPSFREEISKKLGEKVEEPTKLVSRPVIKKVEITDVEENAEKLKRMGKRDQDIYKEQIGE